MSDVANSLEKHWALLPSSRAVEANSAGLSKLKVSSCGITQKTRTQAERLVCSALRHGMATLGALPLIF